MTSALDQKGLEAAMDAKPFNSELTVRAMLHQGKAGYATLEAALRAYLSTVIPAEIAGVVERLERLAGEMERHLGPPEMAPGPDADDLRQAATLIERLAASQAETRRLALEEAAKVVLAFERDWDTNVPWREQLAACLRSLIDQPSTEGGNFLASLSAAGFRILGPDEVDPVTLERAAEVAANWGSEIPAEIRALGRKA